jgi:hypothetical protein
MNKPQWKEIAILILCILIGFILRFYTFDQKSLWIDEIHTFNDSKDNFNGQIKYYKEHPTSLHPPLFFVLSHLFYPFTKPERDLRIIPLIFGVLSIPMIYLLARQFSSGIAIPCALSLTFMAYHINLSQDGRAYSLLLCLGMGSLYFFVKHLETNKRRYLSLTAVLFAISFHTSYASIPYIALSQILWLYRLNKNGKKTNISNVFMLNGLTLLLCTPWILFTFLNYKGQITAELTFIKDVSSFWSILLGILNDWCSNTPLIFASIILFILFPFFSKPKKNAILLLAFLVLPISGVFFFRELSGIHHFIASRYFINFLPFFIISIYLSLDNMEAKFVKLKGFMRLKSLFVLLFIASNLIILPLYYRSEKQDFRGLVNYLNSHLREGDKIFVRSVVYIPGMLHYFKINPESRHHELPYFWNESTKEIEFRIPLPIPHKNCTIYFSNQCCAQYVADGSRLWIIADKDTAEIMKKNSPAIFMGYFDGSFANFNKFPTDASMYLFLWDPKSPGEKGIDMPIE